MFSILSETRHLFLTALPLEHIYLIIILFVVFLMATEKLVGPRRKLRNRSDRIAWGRRTTGSNGK